MTFITLNPSPESVLDRCGKDQRVGCFDLMPAGIHIAFELNASDQLQFSYTSMRLSSYSFGREVRARNGTYNGYPNTAQLIVEGQLSKHQPIFVTDPPCGQVTRLPDATLVLECELGDPGKSDLGLRDRLIARSTP